MSEYKKICENCGKERFFKNKQNYNKSSNRCGSCASKDRCAKIRTNKPVIEYKRICEECGIERILKTK
jgi:DNA-directed RNA polymerase subunit RPC12/RpoP